MDTLTHEIEGEMVATAKITNFGKKFIEFITDWQYSVNILKTCHFVLCFSCKFDDSLYDLKKDKGNWRAPPPYSNPFLKFINQMIV